MRRRRLATLVAIASLIALVATPSYGAQQPAARVAIAVAPGKIQHGINVVWHYEPESNAKLNGQFATTLRYVKSLGANSIAIDFDLYTPGPTSNVVAAGKGTPPPMDVLRLIQTARRYGLFVVVRPVVDESNPALPWRGKLNPTNLAQWFASYDSAIEPYVYAARLGSANEFVMQSELVSLGAARQWSTVAYPFIRKYYGGSVMVNVVWTSTGMVPRRGLTWGLDFYLPVRLPSSATVAELLKGWTSWLKRLPLPEPTDKTYIMETALAAQAPAYSKPSEPDFGTPIIPSVQTKWFHAACDFYKENHFRGLYFYSTDLIAGPQTKSVSTIPMDFQGTSLTEIKSCFG